MKDFLIAVCRGIRDGFKPLRSVFVLIGRRHATKSISDEYGAEVIFEETQEEFNAIIELMNAGELTGLTAELIWSFGQARAAGDDVITAVQFACREWDV